MGELARRIDAVIRGKKLLSMHEATLSVECDDLRMGCIRSIFSLAIHAAGTLLYVAFQTPRFLFLLLTSDRGMFYFGTSKQAGITYPIGIVSTLVVYLNI